MTPLTRDLILSVATEEAAAACASLNDTLGMATNGGAKLARRRAMERLLRETECNPRDLAKLWGCDPCVVYRAKHLEAPTRSAYDPDTARRLQWAHGKERAARIVAGIDAATIADIESWRRLCLERRAEA